MKKFLAIAIALAMVLCCFAACGGNTNTDTTTEAASEEATSAEAAEGTVIELGNSGLKIAPEKKYVKGELTEEDTDENQVAYYASEETLVDFDVYEWAKADGEALESAVNAEAAEYEATAEMTELNGIAAAFYTATEESDGAEYKTATYMIDNGDEFVEIVFWLDGETAEAEVAAILATLTK